MIYTDIDHAIILTMFNLIALKHECIITDIDPETSQIRLAGSDDKRILCSLALQDFLITLYQ